MSGTIRFGRYPDTLFGFDLPYPHTLTSIYVSGSPGQGKSTFLGNLAEQFHGAGEGVLLMDIKGDLTKEVSARARRPEDVVYVKAGPITFADGSERYWTLNPFEGHLESSARKAQIQSSVVSSFERLGLANYQMNANIRYAIQNLVPLALSLPEPTYLDLYSILASTTFREAAKEQAKGLHPVVEQEWGYLEHLTSYGQQNLLHTTRNRLVSIASNNEISFMFGSYHATLRLREWLDAGKMVLIDLGLPLTRETGTDIGNLIMAQLMTEIYTRPTDQRARPWRIVVDEFHEFVGRSFSEIIAQARSYGAFSVVANQDRGQFQGEDGKALLGALGHARVSVHLEGSREDRVGLASLYGQDTVDEFYGLPQHVSQIEHPLRPLDDSRRHRVLLSNWLYPAVDGQYEALYEAAKAHTIEKQVLRKANYRNYWDRLGEAPKRDRKDRNGNTQPTRPNNRKAQAGAEPEVRPLHDQDPEAGRLSDSQTMDAPHPGRGGQTRAIDQFDAPRPPLPGPVRRGRKPGKP